MNENNVTIHITKTAGGGACERCGAQAEQLYHVTMTRNGKTNAHDLCRNCTAAAKRYVEKKQAEAAGNAPKAEPKKNPAEPTGAAPKPQAPNRRLIFGLLAAFVLVIIVAIGIGVNKKKFNAEQTTDPAAQTTATQPASTAAPTTAPEPEDEDVDDSLIQKLSSVLIVDDAAYEYYNFVPSVADRYAGAVSRAADSLKGTARVFDLVVPTSMDITLSNVVRKRINSDDQKKAIETIYAALSSNVTAVNTFDTLRQHRKEYVYFRTDHHWTALGAYYAYREFAAAAGIRPAELSEFTERQFDNFVGAFYNDSGKKAALEKNPDTVYAYEPKATNEMEFTDKKGNTVKWNIITDVSKWNRGSRYNTFIGGDNPYSYIKNPAITDGSSCLVVKESFGNAFVPFLVANYGEVHVIDYRYWHKSLTEFVKAKGIQDVIFVNNTSATRNAPLVKNLDAIC